MVFSIFFVTINLSGDSMNGNRDGLGLIRIEEDSIKNFNKTDKKGVYSFEYDNNKYYLKELKHTTNLYNELIGYEIGKKFGINVVPNDLATIDNYVGYLSKDYMKEEYVYLEDLLRSFYGTFVNKNNLDDVSFMFMSMYNDEVAKKIIDELINLMMFDIIIANSDRHDRNIIIDTKEMKLGPVADNEMLLSDLSLYDHYYSFSVKNSDGDRLEEFLDILSNEQLKNFKDRISIINEKNIQSIIKRIESKLGEPMVEGIKNRIIDKFKRNHKTLSKAVNNKIKKKGKSKTLCK